MARALLLNVWEARHCTCVVPVFPSFGTQEAAVALRLHAERQAHAVFLDLVVLVAAFLGFSGLFSRGFVGDISGVKPLKNRKDAPHQTFVASS